MADKRWAAYERQDDGKARLLGHVVAADKDAAVKAAMREHGLPWRRVAVRHQADDVAAAPASIDVSRPGEERPWDGTNYEYHDLCTMFPPMAADVFAKLVESVRAHGPKRPVVLHEGKILDGRHAYLAYREVGVPFTVREWAGEFGSPLEFVLQLNETRRELTPSQRAALAVEVKRRLGGEYREAQTAALKRGDEPGSRLGNRAQTGGGAREEAAEALNVSARYVSDAERIAEASPEAFEAVKRGEKTIPEAKRDLGLAKPKAKPEPSPGPEPEKPKPSGRTVVNGVEAADADVERERAAGRIPDGVEVLVEDPGEDAGDVVEAAREDRIEAAAKLDELPDAEWLATLPLDGVLKGASLAKFRQDALYYRTFEPMRRSLLNFHGKAAKARYKGSFRGVVGYAVERVLKVEHPSRWKPCPPTDKEGCGGTGSIPLVGECVKCRGRGYIAR